MKKRMVVVLISACFLLAGFLFYALSGQFKTTNIENKMFELWYERVSDAFEPYEEVYEYFSYTEETARKFVENPCWETLKNARTANAAALQLIRSIDTDYPDSFSDEELEFLISKDMEPEMIKVLKDQFIQERTGYEHILENRNIIFYGLIFYNGEIEDLENHIELRDRELESDIDYAYSGINYALVKLPEKYKNKYKKSLNEKYKLIFSSNLPWEDDCLIIEKNIESISDRIEEISTELAGESGANSAYLELETFNDIKLFPNIPKELFPLPPVEMINMDIAYSYDSKDISDIMGHEKDYTITYSNVEYSDFSKYLDYLNLYFKSQNIKENSTGNVISLEYKTENCDIGLSFDENKIVMKDKKGDCYFVDKPVFEYVNKSSSGEDQSDKNIIKKSMRNGKQEVTYKDGSKYYGDFLNGKFDGQGTLEYPGGKTYEGEWERGEENGAGILKDKDRVIYDGEWKNGKFNGRGVFYYEDGSRYEGAFASGQFNGKGTLTYPDGRINYTGNWVDGHEAGFGKYYFEDGSTYEGMFKNGKFEGKGKYNSVKGYSYDGDWADEKFNGKGILTFSDGRKYEGEFKDGQRTGNGKYYSSDGAECEKEWGKK